MIGPTRFLPALAMLTALTALTACSGGDRLGDDAHAYANETESELRRGQTILRIPLLDSRGALLRTHDAELTSNGVAPIGAAFVEFDSARLEAGKRKWSAVAGLVENAQMSGMDLEMRILGEPRDFARRDANGMCWKGDARKAVDLVLRLTDAVFSDQLLLHGWRYKTQKETARDMDEADLPAIWREWRGEGEAILMITASTDDGSEMNVGLVPKCR